MQIDEQSGWTKGGTMTMKMKGQFQGGATVDMVGEIKFGESMQE